MPRFLSMAAGRFAALSLLSALLLAACESTPPQATSAPLVASTSPVETRTAAQFAAWRTAPPERQAELRAFEAFLQERKLDTLVPLHQLLRSASDWQRCEAQPFAVPPEAQWPHVESTLRLLAHLKATGVLREIELHSAYRDGPLNSCAGGAARSVHLVGFAIDFHPLNDPEAGERLCRFWREQGETWKMGLSRYPSGRVHIDTWRFRTWGADHSGKTAFCALPSAMVPASTPTP